MGRKLSPLETGALGPEGASLPDGTRRAPASPSLNLQARIAGALGLPVTALSRSGHPEGAVPDAADGVRAAEIALSRDCSDLIAAYTRILDPEERRRLLKLVRDAADAG